MTFTDAAVEVLRLIGRPLHYKEITDFAIDKNLLSHVGKSPEVTMGARLAALMKKDAPDCPLVRVKPGVFALREWDDKTIRAGMDGKRGKRGRNAGGEAPSPASPVAAPEEDEELEAAEAEPSEAEEEAVVEADTDAEAAEAPVDEEDNAPSADAVAAQAIGAASTEDDDDEILVFGDAAPPSPPPATPKGRSSAVVEEEEEEPPAPEERMRAELLAGAAEIFDEEDDDDQPLLGGGEEARGESQDSRRRRRRRRRGRGTAADGALPSYTATPVEGAAPAPRPQEVPRERDRNDRDRDRDRGERDRGDRDRGDRDRNDRDRSDRDRPEPRAQVLDLHGDGGPNVDDLAGRDLGDAVAQLLGTFDRNLGPVSLRQVAETAQRRGKIGGDQQLVQSLVAAAVRADNHRRIANGLRPRFRFAGGRVGLTDWVLSNELVQAEAEAIAAVERYREASRRAFAKKIGELPGHAFVELASLALERVGVCQLRAIRRAGVPGYEAHFTGLLKSVGEDLRIAVVIRRDGREIGRERVTELRGALHHYGPATVGWILTSGQVLSGAREEAGAPGAAPISLTDGYGLARLCEEHDVAVIRSRLPIAIPDIDLLEALRAS